MNATNYQMRTMCQTCQCIGSMQLGACGKPAWCACVKGGGPYVAAPGTIVKITFESHEAAAFREQCRLASNAERGARDDLSQRWVRCGRGYRELPPWSAKCKALARAYALACRALRKLQRQCVHPERSMFNRECCGVCKMHVETDVEQHRHLVRQGYFNRTTSAERRAAFTESKGESHVA